MVFLESKSGIYKIRKWLCLLQTKVLIHESFCDNPEQVRTKINLVWGNLHTVLKKCRAFEEYIANRLIEKPV